MLALALDPGGPASTVGGIERGDDLRLATSMQRERSAYNGIYIPIDALYSVGRLECLQTETGRARRG